MYRRDFTKRLLEIAAMSGAAGWAMETPEASLRDIAAKKNLLVGTAVSYAELQQPPFTKLLSEQANTVVSENDMKWQNIHPEPDRFDFRRADALLSFATEHQQKVRGHNLCWDNQLPRWFPQVATRENAANLLRQHIAKVAGHFAGQIHSWDVVNEAINVEDGRPDGLRNSIWLQLLGPDYIGIAYHAASEADPHALLTYNDYDIEQDGPKFDAKRRAVLKFLASMRQRKIPINALGLQSHLVAGTKPPDWTALNHFMDEIERLDLQIFVTELDVNDQNLPGSIEERDHAVAELYRDYLTNVLRHSSVKAVLTWGLTDRDTWLNAHNGQGDKRPRRPLPFDSELKPKPAFYAMRDALMAASSR